MSKLKRLSGDEVVKVFLLFGFGIAGQRGSHVKLRRTLPDGSHQSLTIPRHAEIDRGTLKAIYRQGLRFIPESDLKPHIYTQ
jgi:predicted RNA binding protein YcfA (HicA-like mRNA interferase family)